MNKARTMKDLTASAVLVTGIFKFPIVPLLGFDSVSLEWSGCAIASEIF